MSRKDAPVQPFIYVLCKNLPGMIAIPVSELEQKKKGKQS